MIDLYEQKEPELLKKGIVLEQNHPGSLLSQFSAPDEEVAQRSKAAYATLVAAKRLRQSLKWNIFEKRREAPPKISLRRTPLEGLCPPRETPRCPPATQRYRTHDGTCNNARRTRYGSAQLPFHRFLPPLYSDGVETIRRSVTGESLASARFVSLLVHGARDGDAPVTLMIAQWGQFIDHDMTSTAQPRSVNGSVPQCCGTPDLHPSCLPIKVPRDDPWLSPLGVSCLEFLRSAPAQRRDCLLSWREQTNQVTAYLDASPVYSSNPRTSDNARIFRDGLLMFGRGPPREDVCLRGAMANQCVRPGDTRSGEQPGLLAMHHVFVGEHNRIASELADLNQHWSDEKVYQEARRIVGALFQHITYREFLPLVLGREVCRLFDLELLPNGYYEKYDVRVNPGVANSFATAAFRFGHSLVQGSYMRCDRNHGFIDNNVTLHQEFSHGDIGGPGSLHRLLRGLASQRAQKRDEFITPELTNHLFQSGSFPFGLDLAAINIQRGRDHGIPSYTAWREPCGLSDIKDWDDFAKVVGPGSASRIQQAYRSVDDIDLYVGGLAERPVIGGLVGPTFACIIAQQFSNLRRGDRFWYENFGFESSFTPAQLQTIRQGSLAQIICRTLGGGTLQPHIFLPHEQSGNNRLPCGFGPLAPLNLRPWLEKDPFNKQHQEALLFNAPSPDGQPQFVPKKTPPVIISVNPMHPLPDASNIINKVDFIPNGATGFNKPSVNKFANNASIVNNKLDFTDKLGTLVTNRPKRRRKPATAANEVSNKLQIPGGKRQTKPVKHSTTSNKLGFTNTTSSRRTQPKGQLRRQTTTTKPRTQTRRTQTKRKDSNSQREKRETDQTEGRTIFVKIDKGNTTVNNNPKRFEDTNYKPNGVNNKLGELEQKVVISTEHSSPYDIEIKIRPLNQNRPSTTTKRPHVFQNNKPTYTLHPNNVFSSSTYGPDRTDNLYETPRPIITGGSDSGYTPRPINSGYNPSSSVNIGYSPRPISNTNGNGYEKPEPRPISSGYTPRPISSGNNGYSPQPISSGNNGYSPQPISSGGSGYSPPPISSGYSPVSHGSNGYTPRPIYSGSSGYTPTPVYGGDADVTPRPINIGNSGYTPGDNTGNEYSPTNSVDNEYSSSDRPDYSVPNYVPDYAPDFAQEFIDNYSSQLINPRPAYKPSSIDYSNNRPSSSFSYNTSPSPIDNQPRPSTPFSYDIRPTRPSIGPSYANAFSQSYIQTPDNWYIRPQKVTTRRPPALHTFLIVETTRRTTPVYPDYIDDRTSTYSPYQMNGLYGNYQTTTKRYPYQRPARPEVTYGFGRREDADYFESQTEDNDYDITTYAPILNDDFNENKNSTEDTTLSFDLDGYLRPEHMHIIPTNQNATGLNRTDELPKIDDYVVPSLNRTSIQYRTDNMGAPKSTTTNKKTDDANKTDMTTTEETLLFPDQTMPRHPLLEIFADDDETFDETFFGNTRQFRPRSKTKTSQVAIVPLVVLTKPERPDNWVLFDAPTMMPLPELPQLERESGASSEIPQPINLLRHKSSMRV